MTETTDAASDVEVYVKECGKQALLDWLGQHFDTVTEAARKGNQTPLMLRQADGRELEALIIEQAAGKKFTCLWLQSNQGPWPDDVSCARAIHQALGCEVRCNAVGWSPEQDPDMWWQITADGEGEVIWRG